MFALGRRNQTVQRRHRYARRWNGWAGFMLGELAGYADFRCLGTLLPLRRLVLDLLPLIQRAIPGALDTRVVHEQIPAAIVGSNEPISLLGVEPLHCTCCHRTNPPTLLELIYPQECAITNRMQSGAWQRLRTPKILLPVQ